MNSEQTFPKSQLPEGSSGDWSIRRVVLPAHTVEVKDDRPDCFRYRPGSYTELRRGGITFMTDLYDEWWTQRSAIEHARAVGGTVLVTGLGLGIVVQEMLAEGAKVPIERVVVIERSADVIRLAAPSLLSELGTRLCVIEADAFTWKAAPGERFNSVWHDIWPDPMATEVDAEMLSLREHHAPWSDWQGFWPEDYRRALGA